MITLKVILTAAAAFATIASALTPTGLEVVQMLLVGLFA